MKLMSFVVGLASGVMLSRYLGARAEPTQQQATQPAGERDWPTHATPQTDDALRERICSQLQRTIRDADAIQVEVQDGCVTLRGQARAKEVILLMNEVQNTAGVQDVRNELELQGSLKDVLPAHGQPSRRQAEEASSRMS